MTERRVYTPDPAASAVYRKSYRVYRDLYEQTKESAHALGDLYR